MKVWGKDAAVDIFHSNLTFRINGSVGKIPYLCSLSRIVILSKENTDQSMGKYLHATKCNLAENAIREIKQ